jgi:hypothetical protein
MSRSANYVSDAKWAEWTRIDPDKVKQEELSRKRWLETNLGPTLTLNDYRVWNTHLHRTNEGLADLIAEFVERVPGARWFFIARGLDFPPEGTGR